ncbi:MAG: hypothetical protein P0Y65_05380 [Candidatus Devosia phytovorans]|uniref:Uncharacterized protein n=1 Tax=Candidatus Devosia phytovorans TaxID=3121372 RepID=A0AAJ5VYB5_9HYPH|nr:hypothetical protein [Devosia sp.]WEK05687.1 MAG: hypothetical protein P0Y65_05380 [Devosia sp.]
MGAAIGVAALGLGAGMMSARAWWQSGALLDLDFANDRYWWDGREYGSRAAFLAAIGGAVADGVVSFPWTDATVQIQVDALVAEQPTGNEVLYSLDDGSETNCLRARRDSASQVVRLFVIAAGTTLSDIGTQALGRGVVLRTSHSVRTQNFAGAANGAGSGATVSSTALPAVTTMRIGRGASANLPWSGQIRRITIYPDPAPDVATNTAASTPPHDLWLEGDSYIASSAGVGLAASIARLGRRYPLNDGIGGSTLEQSQTRVLAKTGTPRDLPLIFWDGDNNGYGALASDMARYAAMIAALGHQRFLILAPALRSAQSVEQRDAARSLTTALAAAYGTRMIDPMPTLLALANGAGDAENVASGTVPASLLQDGVHLTGPGMDAVAQLVLARLASLGW